MTNIVFMGMGEPLDNVDELFKVLEILIRLLRICLESEANHGFNYRGSQRVKTVS